MIRVLVMGATGMLGHQLFRLALEDPRLDVRGTVRSADSLNLFPQASRAKIDLCDVTSESQLAVCLGAGYEVVVNCVGLTKALCLDPIESIVLNSLIPHRVARELDRRGARLIHVSTDCVFSGARGSYTEQDIPDPVDLYGRSKLLGEVCHGPHLTIRTSFIGFELVTCHGLLEWFLAARGPVLGYARAIWSGLTAITLSRLLLTLALRPEVTGLLHVAGDPIDKYSLLRLLQASFGKADVVIERADQPVMDRSLANQAFLRLNIPIPSWDAMLTELVAAREGRPEK